MVSFMNRLQGSKFYRIFLRLVRFLQFASALSSLVVFSLRIAKVLRLVKKLSTADGAIEGILAAAVAYTIAASLLQLFVKRGPTFLRWLLILLDLAFVGAFIAVAVLTSPNGGVSGPCYGQRKRIAKQNNYANDPGCQLPLGTFVTAIVSTILHALTLVFHEVKDHHHERKVAKEETYVEPGLPGTNVHPNGNAYAMNNDPARSDRVV